MAQRRLTTVLTDFLRSSRDCRRLLADAYRWSAPGAHPHISQGTRDQIVEMAFLRAFLAWEVFLEESFVLYLAGQRPPKGRPPARYAVPPNLETAKDWTIPEGRKYASWTNPGDVIAKAGRFFRGGKPYDAAIRGNISLLDEARIIRNAIAHKSTSARDKFETLVRGKLGALPPNTTVGSFLGTTVMGAVPPITYFEQYIARVDSAAHQIIPS